MVEGQIVVVVVIDMRIVVERLCSPSQAKAMLAVVVHIASAAALVGSPEVPESAPSTCHWHLDILLSCLLLAADLASALGSAELLAKGAVPVVRNLS